MPIVGDRPETGLRVTLERPRGDAPPHAYRGAVHEPEATHAVRVEVDAAGVVTVAFEGAPPADAEALAERVRLVVRTVLRRAEGDARPPPLRIQRWREG